MSSFFDIIDDRYIPEISSKAVRYRHITTGAELLSLANDDTNKVFGITFRTPPPDSTGLPHIMEHSVLAGSRKYPVKEPFIELVKGSLKTFLNAGTLPDRTMYPCASQNLADFYNLVDVYLDAVFYPLLPPRILDQEGWHLDLETLDGPIRFKGVVYNEMKGAYSDPQNYLGRVVRTSLFPDNVYRHDSGGNPETIPDLSFEAFKNYHETYYHPTNALIFFAGDDPPERRLEIIQGYLKDFDAGERAPAIGPQERFSSPVTVNEKYPVREEGGDDRHFVVLSWLLPENDDLGQNLAFQVLEHVLLGTPGSPLRKVMIDSGLGEDLVASGLADYLRQMYFGAGLKGVTRENLEGVEPMILSALEGIVETGIDPGALGAAVNTLEFYLRERNSGGAPRGLFLMYEALSAWAYGWDPIARLSYEKPMNTLKESLASSPTTLEDLIREHLLENPHRLRVFLAPDRHLQDQVARRERARLDTIQASLEKADMEGLLRKNEELRRYQETPDSAEALATIPVLLLEDLERENEIIPIKIEQVSQIEVSAHDLATNGIAYLDLAFDLRSLPVADLPYAPLLGRALLEMGTQKEDFVSLTQRIGQHTGGIVSRLFTSDVRGEASGTGWLVLRAKAVHEKVPELFRILEDILLNARLDDRERFRQILLEEKASLEASMLRAGREVADSRLRRRFSGAAWAREQMTGVDYLTFIRDLVAGYDSDPDRVAARLKEVHAALLNRSKIKANLTTHAAAWDQVLGPLEALLDQIPSVEREPAGWQASPELSAEGLVIPTQVNYVGKGADLYRLGYMYDGSIHPILNFLRTTWLWDNIRVRGGAYGASVSFGRQGGVLTMTSYRDPNLTKTLDVFDRASEHLKSAEISSDEVRKSVIGAIGAIDAYRLPDAKGFTSFVRHLIGESDEERQIMREQVLGTTLAKFREFSDVLQEFRFHGQVAVVGSASAFEAAEGERAGFFTLTNLL